MCIFAVTPLAGVWIEIYVFRTSYANAVVTPLAGVWIEILSLDQLAEEVPVTPLAGVWIEMFCVYPLLFIYSSLPLRECGLKLL